MNGTHAHENTKIAALSARLVDIIHLTRDFCLGVPKIASKTAAIDCRNGRIRVGKRGVRVSRRFVGSSCSSKPAIAMRVLLYGAPENASINVWPQNIHEDHFGIDGLPRQEITRPHFTRRTQK